MKQQLRVLHIEDSERDRALIERHLSRAGYDLIAERVETAEAMRAALWSQPWDVILCDYSMPQFNAIEALALLHDMGLDIPLIIISGTVGEETAVAAMKAGAQDYLMKDNLVRLVPTIERELREAEHRRARRQAEKDLRDSEERYRELVENARDIIYTHDLQGNYTSMNKAGEQITGLTREEALKMSLTQTVAPEYIEKVRQMITSNLAGGGPTVYDLEIIAKDGRRIAIEVSTRLIYQDGEPVGVQGIARDITERRQLEAQLRQAK